MANTLKVIFFDLGNTLIYSINPWDNVLLSGVTEFHRELCQSITNLADFVTPEDLHQCLIEYYDQRTLDLKEKGT